MEIKMGTDRSRPCCYRFCHRGRRHNLGRWRREVGRLEVWLKWWRRRASME